MDIVVVWQSGQSATVALSGQLDIDTGRELDAALDDLREQLVTGIVIDLSGLTFCDSTGLSALVTTHHHCTALGGYLRLAAPSPFLHRVLRVVGIADVIPVYTTVQAARTADPTGLVTANPEPVPPDGPFGADGPEAS